MQIRAIAQSIVAEFSDPISMARRVYRMRGWPVRSTTSHAMVESLVAEGVRLDSVIDVGANRGQFAISVLETVPNSRVHSFEPLPKYRAHFASLVERYDGRLSFTDSALGDTESTAMLTVNTHDQSSSLLALQESHTTAFPDAKVAFEEQVKVVRLDSRIREDDIAEGSLLKIDVQGYERQVLIGAGELLARFDHVLVEASFEPMYEGEWCFVDLIRFMEEKGFRFLRPVGALTDPSTGRYLQMDALFARADR